MKARRTQAEAAVLHDAVLDRWAAGVSGALITSALGLGAAHVSCILHESRRRGDPRAGFRYAVAGRIRMSAPPAPVPAAAQVAIDAPRAALLRAVQAAAQARDPHRARKAAVLDARAAGLDAPTIGAAVGMRWKTVSMIVSRARAKGDARAVRRQHDPADGLSVHMRVALDRLDRRYGVTASIPGETACSQAA
ncbi:hypothetical protein [Methylorubrum thiocyanatum]|uniref:hypothetical protein n=1 Tax=Methylorubrum thiocyanatum TaxID=47958 RepID=UPI003F7F0BEB